MATVTWQGDESANWSVGGNWDTGSKPTAADDVVLSNAAACTIDEAAVCRSFNASAYTGTLTHNASCSLTIGDATAGAGNVALAFNSTANMTYTLGNATTSSISFISTSATVQTINFNGHRCGNITFNAASNGSWQFTGQCGTSASTNGITITKGTVDTNDQTINALTIVASSSGTRTITLGNSTINVGLNSGSSGGKWNMTGTNITFNAETSTINVNSASGGSGDGSDFYGGSRTYNIVNLIPCRNCLISGNNTFATLTYTQPASKTYYGTTSGNQTVTGTFTFTGNSLTNRLLFASDTLGTARTLTLTGATVSGCTNVDFRDITFAGSPDFSGITGGSGDCGGNTGGTLTTADDWYWNGSGTRNFSDYTYWYTATNGGGSQMASTRCPLPQDTCYFDADSIDGATTVDQDMPRIPGIDFTGVDAMTWHSNNLAQEIYGSLIYSANVTIVSDKHYSFYGRKACVLNSNGGVSIFGDSDSSITVGTIGGSLTLTSHVSMGLVNLFVTYGTFDADVYDITKLKSFQISGSGTRTVRLGSGTFTVNRSAGGDVWTAATTTNLTFDAETSSMVLSQSTANNIDFHGGGLTYYNVSIVAGGAGVFTIVDSNTFNTLTINAPKTVKFTAGTDQTVTSFVATGDGSNLIHIDSTSASAATLSDTTGTNTVHYCHIGETGAVNAEGGATWDATDNCNVNSSTGWTVGQSATITPSAIVVRFVVSSVTIDVGSQSATITATAIKASFVAPAVTAEATKNTTIIATAIQVSVVAPSVSVSTGGNASVTATAIKSSFIANSATVEATKNAVAVATVAAVRFLANSVTISATTSAVVSVTSVSVKFVAGVATVQAIRNITIDATSAYAQFLVNSATIVIGGVDSGITEVILLSSLVSKRLHEKSRISKRLNEVSRIDKTLLLDSPIH